MTLAAVLFSSIAIAAPRGDAAAPGPDVTRATNTFVDLPVVGTVENGGTFRGKLDVTTFKVRDGDLVAVGLLTGNMRDANGDLIGRVENERVVMPAAVAAASTCDILKLRLGPLDLDLLGLKVHLDRIVLDITAEAGPGNLLGNLLCAIAGLLDPGLDLDRVIAAILRAILELLS